VEQSREWGLPRHIVDRAPESPWRHDVARFVIDPTVGTSDRDTTSNRWAREVLPPSGATVLDVGCGGGRSSIALVPPATELIGVDRDAAMLAAFARAATAAGAARRTVLGEWPDVAAITPPADVVVCHQVAYDVADIVPFLVALTLRARLAVVVELPTRHPMTAWNESWHHFWQISRPVGPTADDFVAVVRELGLDPDVSVGRRRARSSASSDPAQLVPMARRRLCLPAEREPEVAEFLARRPPAWVDQVATVRWPGGADPNGNGTA
jgi:SAM-dependent methyltransferase